MREKLKGTYQFVNEPSLNQRLKSIVDELSDAFGMPLPALNKMYLRKLVDTRNYYTHLSEELRSRILDGEGMYWARRRVILLLTPRAMPFV
jgi:hypothetical protein